jgi:hypothetical protein
VHGRGTGAQNPITAAKNQMYETAKDPMNETAKTSMNETASPQ